MLYAEWETRDENHSFFFAISAPLNRFLKINILEVDKLQSFDKNNIESLTSKEDPNNVPFSEQMGLHIIHINVRSLLPKNQNYKL